VDEFGIVSEPNSSTDYADDTDEKDPEKERPQKRNTLSSYPLEGSVAPKKRLALSYGSVRMLHRMCPATR
jgi:hypothetical protein